MPAARLRGRRTGQWRRTVLIYVTHRDDHLIVASTSCSRRTPRTNRRPRGTSRAAAAAAARDGLTGRSPPVRRADRPLTSVRVRCCCAVGAGRTGLLVAQPARPTPAARRPHTGRPPPAPGDPQAWTRRTRERVA
ncbi:nitroreductase/quinone reductase family protein [Streptomyces luteolus]|uniref:nitroreductase/quinone reductase family protein n=1 Tax=Streptomyces luteolus TaxID=3043615 RepID=UPI0038CFB2E0